LRLLWIELRDFRNHRETSLEVPDGLVAVCGENGEGKTNLLEGVCYLLTLRSPRATTDGTLVRDGAECAYLRGEVEGLTGKTLVEVEIRRAGANRVQMNRTPLRRKRELRKNARAVAFGPHDLKVVQGEPGARRDFLDEGTRSLWPAGEAALSAYERVLRQRNRLLKDWQGPGRPAGLDTWNQELASSGAAVVEDRRRAVERIAPGADDEFSRLSGSGLLVRYQPNVAGDERAFLARLAEREADETVRRTTLVGPHRDDLEIGVRGLVARGFASYGEAWGAALSLKLGLGTAVAGEFGEEPVLLVDDPFSALDPARRDRVSAGLAGRGQVLVSVADEQDVPSESVAVWEVRGGEVSVRGGAGDAAQ